MLGIDFIPSILELNHAANQEWLDETAAGRLLSSVIPFSMSMLENILKGLVKDQDCSMTKTTIKVLLTSSDDLENAVMIEVEVVTALYRALSTIKSGLFVQ